MKNLVAIHNINIMKNDLFWDKVLAEYKEV